MEECIVEPVSARKSRRPSGKEQFPLPAFGVEMIL